MKTLVHQRKSLVLTLIKQGTIFAWDYITIMIIVIYLFLNGKEIFKFKINNENVNFLTKFFLRSVSNGFRATDSREVSLKGNASDFSVDYNAIDNSGILNIHKYFKGE